MEHLIGIDWAKTFVPDTPLLEIFLRGTVVYLALFVLLRVVLKRESGGVSITDLLVIVLIADAAQNAMADDYSSIPDGILLVATLIFWSYALDWLAYHFPWIERLIHPRPLPLIKDGRVLRDRLREELITESELASQLRLQGVEDPAEVKAAYMEPDGGVSVIERNGKSKGAPEKQI
jgi:uncharacterized membrane protein YcaP (DUF421 family)